MTYSTAEREAIGLCITWEAIDELVNRAILDLHNVDERPIDAEVRFPTMIHRDLFLVRLLDFAKEQGESSLTGVKGSCLAVLEEACKTRSFDVNGSVVGLVESTQALTSWLNERTTLNLWLPSLKLEARLSVPRLQFLVIAGNQAKHNVSRLTGVSNIVAKMLEEHGHVVALEQVPLALDDLREHLQSDYFVYYGSWLAELLNNVRWGLYQYLLPTFTKSFSKTAEQPPIYTYEYPDSISHEIPRQWFWRLMNHCLGKPYVRPFTAAAYMKKEVLR
jgi:hypothetical protein